MNIFLFVEITTFLLLLIFVFFIKTQIKQKNTKAIVVVTRDCEEICEGILRELYFKLRNIGACNFIVIDRYSKDNTYKILNILAKKHNFQVIRDKKQDVQNFVPTKEFEIIEINETTSYKKIFKNINEIRHSLTFNTNIR